MLRLERQCSFSGRAGINQLDGTDPLNLSPVLEENQSRQGQGAISFRKRSLLNTLSHRALYPYGDHDRRWRTVGLTLLALSASTHAGFRLRCSWHRRLPLGIFDG